FPLRGCVANEGGAIEPAGDAMGNDERDGQLSWGGVALALHLLVPDPALQYLAERRCVGHGHNGNSHGSARGVSLSALCQSAAILPRRPPPDLARVLSGRACRTPKRRRESGSGN